MKVLYLFTSYRGEAVEKVKRGEQARHGFWGMFELPSYGIDAWYVEPEHYYPKWLSEFIRRTMGVYFLHLSIFFRLLFCDLVFTSTAFGTQLVHTLWPFKKSRWVMHDFSITGLIGNEKTFKQKLMAHITSRCAGIVTLGIEEKERLEKRFPHLKGKIEFITFGVDLNFFKPMEVEQDGKVFAVGFDPDRDWKTLFEAVQDTQASVVVATRPQRVAKLQVPANVRIAQFTPRALAKEYAKSAIIVVPLDTSKGINDAMGSSTLFEAMAAGKPVIATNTHTIASFIEDGKNGILVPERDPEALRDAIQYLLQHPEVGERLGRNARAYAEQYLDAEMLAGRLAAFFKRL